LTKNRVCIGSSLEESLCYLTLFGFDCKIKAINGKYCNLEKYRRIPVILVTLIPKAI